MTDSSLTMDSIVTANSGLMVSEVDGELVMMDVDKGSYYGLDPVAARIWQAIAEPTSIADVCAKMMEMYEVDAATCEAEVLGFVSELLDAGLVRAQG